LKAKSKSAACAESESVWRRFLSKKISTNVETFKNYWKTLGLLLKTFKIYTKLWSFDEMFWWSFCGSDQMFCLISNDKSIGCLSWRCFNGVWIWIWTQALETFENLHKTPCCGSKTLELLMKTLMIWWNVWGFDKVLASWSEFDEMLGHLC
jgi:hypothetical protein